MRNKQENAVFLLTRYARSARVETTSNTMRVTNYSDLSASDKVNLETFISDCPNVVKQLNGPTELRIV